MRLGLLATVAAVSSLAPAATAQDLYDQDLFRPIGLTFYQSDYWEQLLANKWNFQLWYRDANPTPTSNTSNGLAITFE